MSFWTEKNKKSKKRHQCNWCSSLILKNTNYNHQSGMTSEGFNTLKFHLDCAEELRYTLKESGINEYEDIQEIADVFKNQYADEYYKNNQDCEYSSS